MEEKTCLILWGIFLGFSITVFICSQFITNVRYFNANRFKCSSKDKDKIVPIEFHVVKIEKASTQYEESVISKPLWKYTVECYFFFKTNDKKFINDKYIFWDEPEKYKVGDILTLTNIKQ